MFSPHFNRLIIFFLFGWVIGCGVEQKTYRFGVPEFLKVFKG